jgi:enoyl-[acyl-carrier protein] reductase II
MVLLPLIRENVSIPIIAAGGINDGMTMAAAFALGAEGGTDGYPDGLIT